MMNNSDKAQEKEAPQSKHDPAEPTLTVELQHRLQSLVQSIIVLRSYLRHGINARAFMIAEHSNQLSEIKTGTGRYEDYPPETLLALEQRHYVEVLERLCQMIEDFAIVSRALLLDLSQFPGNITRTVNPQDFIPMSDENINTILRYRSIDDFTLSEGQKEFVLKVREQNLRVIQEFQEACRAFLERHWRFYQKHKHGNTLLYGMPVVETHNGRSVLIPAIENQREPERVQLLMVTDSIFKCWSGLFNSTVRLLRDILERNVRYLERGEVGFLEFSNLFPMSKEDSSELKEICAENDSIGSLVDPQTELNLEISEREQRRYDEQYQRIEEFLTSNAGLWQVG